MAADPFSSYLFDNFPENALPACVGSTNLDIDTKLFTSKFSFSRPQNGSDEADFGHEWS